MSNPDSQSDDPVFAIEDHLDAVTEMVVAASTMSLRWYRRLDRAGGPGENKVENTVENKSTSGFDPVTEADRAVETDLRDRLAERFPDHAIMGEEFGLTGDGRYRWTIDPIDGTRAFITGQPMWGTLLGLQIDARPVAGWMHLPVLGETYIGHGGAGGVCRFRTADGDVRNLSVSGTTELEQAVVLCTHPTMFAAGPQAEAFGRVAEAARMVRYSGDCVNYGLLAMGLADSVVENGLASYDILPLIPIVEAAGGVVSDLNGAAPLDGGYVVASATEALHRQTLAMLNG